VRGSAQPLKMHRPKKLIKVLLFLSRVNVFDTYKVQGGQ